MNQSQQLRQLIYNEVNKQFDFQPDVLYEAIKDKPIEGTTVKDYLQQHFQQVAPGKNLEAAIYSLHYVQFAVPVHLDKWNPSVTIPVAFLPADWDEATLQALETFNPDGSTTQLSAKEEPSFPVLVVSQAERVDAKGNLCVDQRGIVLAPECRIPYSQAIALAEKRHSLKAAVKAEPFVIVLPDDSFKKMEARIKYENLLRQKEEQKFLSLIENSTKKHLKSTMNANVKQIQLTGFSNLPRAVNLEWNNPTGLTLRYYIYATGYFNVNGVKTLKEKQLVKSSDNLKDAIILDYPYEIYNIWIEGRYYQNSLQAISNYLIVHTSERNANSEEYVSHYYFSESKIRQIEGWYVNDIELQALYTLAEQPTSGKITEIGLKNPITTKGEWSWYGWHVIDTERDMSFDDGFLFRWERIKIGSTNEYTYFNNGVYNIRWREYDADGDGQKLEVACDLIKLVSMNNSNNEMAEQIYEIAKLTAWVYKWDEDLGEYEVTWWTPSNQRFNPKTGFLVNMSFK